MLKLYAQAAIYRPPVHSLGKSNERSQLLARFLPAHFGVSTEPANDSACVPPKMPFCAITRKYSCDHKHFDAYNLLTSWHSTNLKVHPNYIQTLSLPMQLEMMTRHPFPFKPFGLVHLANHISVNNLPRADQAFTIRTCFGKVYFHRKGWVFEVKTEAYVSPESLSSEPSIRATSYYLSRQKHSSKHIKQLELASETLPSWISEAINADLFKESNIDDVCHFNEAIGRQYARISGDYNPIHLYPYTARLMGFKQAIAHGMYSKALAVSRSLSCTNTLQNSFSIETVFSQPILLPSAVKLCSLMSEQANEPNRIEFAVMAENQKREKLRYHLRGKILQQ